MIPLGGMVRLKEPGSLAGRSRSTCRFALIAEDRGATVMVRLRLASGSWAPVAIPVPRYRLDLYALDTYATDMTMGYLETQAEILKPPAEKDDAQDYRALRDSDRVLWNLEELSLRRGEKVPRRVIREISAYLRSEKLPRPVAFAEAPVAPGPAIDALFEFQDAVLHRIRRRYEARYHCHLIDMELVCFCGSANHCKSCPCCS